jgi:hypothetical protein
MPINPISSNSKSYAPAESKPAENKPEKATPPAKQKGDKVSFSHITTTSLVKNTDLAILNEMLEESNRQAENFRVMIEKLLLQQSGASLGSIKGNIFKRFHGKLGEFFSGLEVDDETQKWAQEMVGENGYYGVKQTSERILKFAKTFAGDDLDKLELMRSAAKAGFGGARQAWGSEMPSITQQTYDAVMAGFDEWRASIEAKNE